MQKIFNGQILRFFHSVKYSVSFIWVVSTFSAENKTNWFLTTKKKWRKSELREFLIRRIYYLAIRKYVEFIIRLNAIVIIDIVDSASPSHSLVYDVLQNCSAIVPTVSVMLNIISGHLILQMDGVESSGTVVSRPLLFALVSRALT